MIKKGRELLQHPFLSGSVIMFGGGMLANGVNYFYHLSMGRVLGPLNYGTLVSIYSILYISVIIPQSASFAIVKFVSAAKSRKEVNSIYVSTRKAVLYLSVFIVSVFLVLTPAISNFLHIEERLSVVFVSVIVFFNLLIIVNRSTLQGLLKFLGVVTPEVLSSFVKLLLGLLLVYLGFGVSGAIGAVVVAAILAYLLSRYFVRNFVDSTKASKYDIKPIIKYSLPVLVQALAFTSLFTVDLILVKHFLPAFQAGLYAALSTLGKIIYFATQPITAVMFPIISGRRAKGEGYRKVFYASVAVTVAVTFGVVSFYYVFPDIAIGVLYGKEYLTASTELVGMGIFMSMYTLSYLFVNFLLSLGRTKSVILPIVVAVLQVVLIWIYHDSLSQIISVNIVSMTILFLGLLAYMGYNQFKISYAKGKE